jgi:hypothetical protein
MEKGVTPLNKMPIIQCECGAQILLIQKLDLMGKAIDNHVEEHRTSVSDPIKANALAKHIEDLLIKQVFEKIQVQP